VGGGVQLGPLGTAATNRPIVPALMIMMMEKFVEWLAGEPEVLGENLPQFRFVHHKPHVLPGREPGPLRREASDKPLELRHVPMRDTEGLFITKDLNMNNYNNNE
jgi:hypothetical protein